MKTYLVSEDILRQVLDDLRDLCDDQREQFDEIAQPLRTILAKEPNDPVVWIYQERGYTGHCPVRYDPPNEYEPKDRWSPLFRKDA